MDCQGANPRDRDSQYNARFLEFIKLFQRIGKDERLFPKTCSTCGAEYHSFSEFLQGTRPLGHGLQDVQSVMRVPYTMQYRNCACGSTLVLPITEEVYPELNRFWHMLRDEAESNGRSLLDVVSEFRDQCNRYVLDQMIAEEEPAGHQP